VLLKPALMASRGYREIVTSATDARPRDVASSSILEPFIS